MHFTTTFIASVLALTSTAMAAQTVILNNCPQQTFLTITHQDQSSRQIALAANGGVYSEPTQGQGNSYGVTKSSDYYSANTPKLIFGASDSSGTVYYSLNNVNGNPFDGQNVNVQSKDCPTAYADGSVKACSDSNDLVLSLC